jgi:hypothetical protein
MNLFKKYIDGNLCQATPIYNGYYNDEVFVMKFKNVFWFNQEVRGLGLVSNKPYAPEVLSVNALNKEIKFKWYNSNLNHLFHFNTNIPTNWKQQIKAILKDLENVGLYKLNIYPHTFYVKNSKIHIMDLHACLCYDDIIEESSTESVINDKNRFQFENSVLNIKNTYNYTIEHNIGNWPGNFLND